MHKANWDRMEQLLLNYNIAPVGCDTDCRDEKLYFDHPDAGFWARVRHWQSAGWDIFASGTHVYTTTEPGLVPLSKKSEFAGLSLEDQKTKIGEGTSIFAREKITADMDRSITFI